MSSFSSFPKKNVAPFIWIFVVMALWGSFAVSRYKRQASPDALTGTSHSEAPVTDGGAKAASDNAGEMATQWQTSFEADSPAATNLVAYPAWQADKKQPNPVFDWKGGIPEEAGAGSTAVRRHIAWNEDPNILAMEFQTDAPQWELLCAPKGGGWRVLMHDVGSTAWQVVGSWKSPDGDAMMVQIFQQKGNLRKARRWRVEYSNQLALGVKLKVTESIAAKPTTPPLMRVVWCGDSFVEGVGGASMWQGFAAQAGALLNVDSQFDASGGTGYVASGPPGWGRKPYGERIGNIVQANPSAVVIYGSTNDAQSPPQEVANAARKFWVALHQALPKAKIIVIGPIQPNDNWKLKPLSEALRSAAAESNVSFVDATSWIHGTGKVSNPRGDGDADIYTSADGVHPTPAGHAYIAQKTADALRPLLDGPQN